MNQQVRTKPYFDEIDIIKGIAILMVIYSHSFPTFPINIRDGFSNDVISCVTSFDMELFFCASGFLFSLKDSWFVFLQKKIQRILVPYICFCCLDVGARYVFSSFTRSHKLENVFMVIINGDHFWFLHALFFLFILMKLLNGKHRIGIPILVLTVLMTLLTDVSSCKIFHICNIIKFYPFFYLGYLMKLSYSNLKKYLSSLSLMVILIVLFILSYYYGKQCQVVIWYVYPVIGIMSVWCISMQINHFLPMLKTVFSHFGKYSLQYYLNHMLILLAAYYITYYCGVRIPVVNLLICFFATIAISYIMLIIEKQNKYLKKLCGL